MKIKNLRAENNTESLTRKNNFGKKEREKKCSEIKYYYNCITAK